MKNLLYFLLKFFISISFLCSISLADCYLNVYAYETSSWVNYSSWVINPNSSLDFTVSGTWNGHAASGYHAKGTIWKITPTSKSIVGYIPEQYYSSLGQLSTDNFGSYRVNISVNTSSQSQLDSLNVLKCEFDCSDSDSDGVCDQCDIAPDDSSMGKTGYVKGYYEYNGKMVAGLTSFSPENSTYDAIEIYEHDPEIPGYVLGLGMPTHINESEFLAGGGKFVALQTPEQTYEMSCPAVTSLDQCEQIECEIKPVGSSATNELPNNGKGETEVAETGQKAEDAGMLDLDKTCDDLRSKCASSCGGSTNIQSFACSENEHMVCQCLSNGSWELAKDWSEVGKQITITETTTVPSYGTGDSSSGGGSTTSVSGSSDGSLTGSYGYVEGNINYDTLSSHFSQFNSRFPFSLRSTLGSIYSEFKGSGAAPVYTYSVYGKTVTIDLAAWNDIAKMIRSFFALGITLSTIVLLIYLYVGIDLRGK